MGRPKTSELAAFDPRPMEAALKTVMAHMEVEQKILSLRPDLTILEIRNNAKRITEKATMPYYNVLRGLLGMAEAGEPMEWER